MIKMLVAIIVIFVICWAPLLINNLLIGLEVVPDLHLGHHKPIREAFYIMAYANSCVNPVVYTFMSKNFKETFKQTVCICFHRRTPSRKNTLEARSSFGHSAQTADSTFITSNKHTIELTNCRYGATVNTV